jgi:hypothetical protein
MKQIVSILAISGIGLMTSCGTSETKNQEMALQAQQRTIDSMKIEMARQQVMDSMADVAKAQVLMAKTETATKKNSVAKKKSTRSKRSVASASTGAHSTGTYTGNSTTSEPVYQEIPQAPEKKGWSAKAKGAVIGAGTGAAAGAIINKRNRAAGAVIGGVLGAGAGTGIGAVIDKKNGR